ncbi:MAG: bifunctional 3-deoxy-7-phosphoheptulonate synthase/chorismate mutase type II [Bacteroidales bacterium]|jgi:chorismate mutase|nr:bifunctional 3-deoxy-7-phosphoheptulonate synthase/chorismate mutase type II [Bacteroidales bacterium]
MTENKNIPVLVAGPCAAESEKQVLDTARVLQTLGVPVRYFRASAWKPRSQPGSFEGVGAQALSWLAYVQREMGWEGCTEVAKPEHLDLCEQQGIRAVWVGARTTVNPFLTEELARAARGRDLTVMIKNPVMPDLKLWIGAIERFERAGISRLFAIHRGVADPHETVYRNFPCWELAIDLKVHLPQLPLLCDASHIAGQRPFLREISNTALQLGFDGLMLETHINPLQAKSDALQQLSPDELFKLWNSLFFKNTDTTCTEDILRKQRALIMHIDTQIARLLKQRIEKIEEIAELKKEHDLPIVHPAQFNKIRDIYIQNGLQDNGYKCFINDFLELLHKHSISRQQTKKEI